MEDFDLPPSLEELSAAKSALHSKISFLDLMKGYSSKIEECWHTDFTHKCTCPLHGNGQERTPSFYFSERSKTYKCFSCSAGGDVFDLIGVMEGRPWFYVVKDMFESSNIHVDQIDLSELKSRPARSDIVYNANLKMSDELRKFLKSVEGHKEYDKLKEWVDWIYRRIDDRLGTLDDSSREEVVSFKIQIMMELDRKKMSC